MDSQALRFDVLLALIHSEDDCFSVNDYGCGYGAFLDVLLIGGDEFEYLGFDISERHDHAGAGPTFR